ncbi:UBX domain-containing protein 6-like [Saccoglossus kowalevskii]|uniref:UBX domain-containing protein 6-like n=1 Tax=Saccoglossus kowalevskii TaxID=10224 RepID=A0ABM0MHC3_SACKO|nr:PREDICTED: UBX domain-containing protein 6-like [Saccoglossus kowalevskii]
MKKFFEKKKLDFKFKKAGTGHSLSDESPSTSSQGVITSQPVAKQPPPPKSAGAMKAGEAALTRIDQKKQEPISASRKAIQAQVRREMEQEKAAAEAAAALSRQQSGPGETKLESAPLLSVEKVQFYCSLSPQRVPRSQIESHIKECLLLKLAEDPIQASCAMIHSLNKDREKMKVGIDTICKYLDNIISHPGEEKYTKIRIQNKAFQDKVACIEGSEEFLQSVGFTRQMMPHQDSEAEFFVLDQEYCSDTDRLRAVHESLVSTEPIRPILDRNTQIFEPCSGASQFHLPDEFYNLTAEEIKREQQLRTDMVERNAVLRTKAMREKEEQREIRKYNFTLIRVKFPNGIILQGIFRSREKVGALMEFVRQSLENDWMPFILSTSTGQKITNEDAFLVECQLFSVEILIFPRGI